MSGVTHPPGVCAYCGARSTEQCASWCMEADYRETLPPRRSGPIAAEEIAERLGQREPPAPAPYGLAEIRNAAEHHASDSRTIADIAGELRCRQATALDEGCAALLRAGVDVRDIEIVHETYSRSEEPFVIHLRAYVRVRRESKP